MSQPAFTCSKSKIETPKKKVGNLFKVNDKDTKTTSRRRSGVFIVNTEQISHIVVMFLLLTLNKEMPAGVRQMLSIKIE